MANLQLLLIFLGLICLSRGWQQGTQYVYKYVGRSAAGLYGIKQQNALVEFNARIFIQSIDDQTLIVKLTEGRIKRNGKYLDNPYFSGEYSFTGAVVNPGHPDEIEGVEDPIPSPEILGAPFVITHNKGSIVNIKINENEPEWIANFKKSIAGQLQIDITGVRNDGPPVEWTPVSGDIQGATFNVFEDSIVGDCSTAVRVSRLPTSQVYAMEAYKLGSWESTCHDKPVWEIVKTKDFNRCQRNPVWYFANPANHECTFGTTNCGEFLQRTSVFKYVACGESINMLTIVHASGFSDLLATPFATKTEPLANSVIIDWALVKTEQLSNRLTVPTNTKTYESLTYTDSENFQDGTKATLKDALVKSPVPVSTLTKNVYEALRIVAKDLKERPDSEKDNLERLSVIGRVLPMFDLDGLRALWEDVRTDDYAVITMFVDCLVQSGSNPAIKMLTELVETKQITEVKAEGAVAAIGFYAKTPTSELFRELLRFLKSSTLKSSKGVRQATMLAIAELIHTACASPYWSIKRWPTAIYGEFCTSKDAFITEEFLPFLINELESYELSADRMIGLTALGTLGVEEILPHLRQYIVGTEGKFNDVAERVRAVWSLNRVAFIVPEKVHPWLASIAGNVAERPDVRMAALDLLFTSNAPISLWQKFAASTWFEPSHQVITYTNSLLNSFAKVPVTNPMNKDWARKANVALPMVKPAPFGMPYSMDYTRASHMKEDMTVLTRTKSYRIADEPMPTLFGNRYFYQLGPFHPELVSLFIWNYNMGNVWQNMLGKFYKKAFPETNNPSDYSHVLGEIWDELNVIPRPADKSTGMLQVHLMGAIHRMFNLEKLEEMIPTFFAEMMKYEKRPYEVSVAKYRMLAEYNIRMPTELGLPMRFLSTVPVLFSLQGILQADGMTGIKSNMASEFSWKINTELRVEMPWSGNYIASGVDVRVDTRLPREMGLKYHNGEIQFSWTPGNKVTDLIYYHVKPYTISRNMADSATPTVEDPNVHFMNRKEPTERSLSIGERWGVNVRLHGKAEYDWTDLNSWKNWLKKWDIHGMSNLGFVPLKITNRHYVLRYEPEGTRARSFVTRFSYQAATKTCTKTKVYESGSSNLIKHEQPLITYEMKNYAEYEPVFNRLFQEIASGNANVYAGGFVVELKDGTFIHFKATLGKSNDAWWSKGFTDAHVEKYTTSGPSGSKEVDWALCWTSASNWNKPPTYGFSKDILYLTREDTIYFGEHCDQNKIRLKAKMWRDESAANTAVYSPAGQQCQLDMKTGLMYGSPACTEARRLDQTYNNYEMNIEAEVLPEPVSKMVNIFRRWFTWVLYPYTVKQTTADQNPSNRATWIIKRDPYLGWSNMTIIRPTETLVAQNIRISKEYVPFSPIALALARTFYPVRADSAWFREMASVTTGGVTEAQCFVGPDTVHTFDGASYNYTINGCHHILLTDCHRKTHFAVTSRKGNGNQQIVTVMHGKDTIELDPSGYVTVNGNKVSLEKGKENRFRFEIRAAGMRTVKAVVYLVMNEGIIFEARDLHFFVKVQDSHVQMSAPYNLRGRTCGLCGDYNQEIHAEWKSPGRCTLSSGELMASSYKLKAGEECSTSDYEVTMKLKKETEKCQPIDLWFRTYLPSADLTRSTKCTRYEKMHYQGTYVQGDCETTEYRAYCQPGCKPYMMATKPFNFKCKGQLADFVAPLTVPTACVSA